MPPGTPANPVLKTIKGSGGDHADIAAWAADTDDNCVTGWGAGDYASACSPTGVLYSEDYAGAVTFTGATTDITHYRTLTVAAGNRHNGAFPKVPAGARVTGYLQMQEDYFLLEWEIVEAGSSMSSFCSVDYDSGSGGLIRKLVIDVSTSGYACIRIDAGNSTAIEIHNCFGIARRSSDASCFRGGYQDDSKAKNCTCWVVGDGSFAFGAYLECKNCIGLGTTGGTDFASTCTGNYNISGDGTAPVGASFVSGNTDSYTSDYRLLDSGANFVVDGVLVGMIVGISGGGVSWVTVVDSDGKGITVNDPIFTSSPIAYGISNTSWRSTPTALFADTTSGAEDLHLLDGSTLADGAGTDLSADLEVAGLADADDIDAETRVDWDIGADEVLTAGGGVPKLVNRGLVNAGPLSSLVA